MGSVSALMLRRGLHCVIPHLGQFRLDLFDPRPDQAWFNLGISEKAFGNEAKADEASATACQMKTLRACEVAA